MDDARRTLLTTMIAGEPERLRRRSISLGVPVDDADDVAQLTLLRAWRGIEHLERPEPGQMCSWLDTIARNAAIDLARLRARRPDVPLDEDAPDDADVAGAVEIRTFLDGALAALHALPESLREPLLLTAVDGLTTAQVAERLGIAPATARQRISRARKALSACRRSGMEAD
jgi:RNA polymerase sigma factor (sigma-70 family)